MKKKRNLVVALFSHPQYYPPTLNALEMLSEYYDSIYVVHRNIRGFDWKYPANVQLIGARKLYKVEELEKASIHRKIGWFLHFTWLLFSVIRKSKPITILLYDAMPVLSYRMIHFFTSKPRVLWYHNHDVIDKKYLRKYSLTWFAWKSESWIFPRLTIFSLPASERQAWFVMDTLKGRYFLLPNYPLKKRYPTNFQGQTLGSTLKLIYQGTVGKEHGLANVIGTLNENKGSVSITLHIVGPDNDNYRSELEQVSAQQGAANKVTFQDAVPYSGLAAITKQHHVGIGIYIPKDAQYQTITTASNKIYEYAAMGLPVMLYDTDISRKHMDQYTWAFFTDCSHDSLTRCLQNIAAGYEEFSRQAQRDFAEKLNFENYFQPVMRYLQQMEVEVKN